MKIAVIDSDAVLEQLPQREQIGTLLEAEFSQRVSSLREMQEDLGAMLEQAQRDSELMSGVEKMELTRSIESKKYEIEIEGEALDEDMLRRQDEEQQKLLVKIGEAVSEIATLDSYDVVLQRAAVVYCSPAVDIGARVVSLLSAG